MAKKTNGDDASTTDLGQYRKDRNNVDEAADKKSSGRTAQTDDRLINELSKLGTDEELDG